MTVYVETQSICVASLKDYNAGNLHYIRINLNECEHVDEVWDKIKAMLAASPEAREFPQGGPAEEHAIHDYEGFGTWHIHEYDSINKVFAAAKLIEEKGAPASEWLANDASILDREGMRDPDQLIEHFEGCFMGEFDSKREYAEQAAQDMGLPGIGHNKVDFGFPLHTVDILEELSSYLDWDALAEYYVGDYTVIQMSHSGGFWLYRDEP